MKKEHSKNKPNPTKRGASVRSSKMNINVNKNSLSAKKRIWYYFPIPLFFNISMLTLFITKMYNNSGVEKLLNSGSNVTDIFLPLGVLVSIFWALGTVLSIIVSPIIYKINQSFSFKKDLNFGKIFMISIVLFTWLVVSVLLSSGVQNIIVEEYRPLVSPFMYGFVFSYTYTVSLFWLWLSKREKNK